MPPSDSTIYAFDLDGTVTSRELLPAIAEAAGIGARMAMLTRRTLSGELSFNESFRMRVNLLARVPLCTVHAVVSAMPLDPDITAFIHERQDTCALVTGNLDCWIQPLVEKVGCRAYCSIGCMEGGVVRVLHVLDKGEAIRNLKRNSFRVIAVGESANDVPMFQAADESIAFGGVHAPARVLLPYADHAVQNGAELCALLRRL